MLRPTNKGAITKIARPVRTNANSCTMLPSPRMYDPESTRSTPSATAAATTPIKHRNEPRMNRRPTRLWSVVTTHAVAPLRDIAVIVGYETNNLRVSALNFTDPNNKSTHKYIYGHGHEKHRDIGDGEREKSHRAGRARVTT